MVMMNVKTRCAALVVFSFLAAGGVRAADVQGAWQAEFDTQIGVQKYSYTFQQDGSTLTGKANSDIAGEKREVTLQDVKLDGDTLTFAEVFEFQGNQIRIDYTGKVSGGEIKFTRKVGDFATEEFVARRGAAASTPSGERPAPQPGRRRGPDFGAPVPLGPDDKPAFPAAPAGFDASREGIARGTIEMVEYDSKTLGIKRRMTIYTPPGYTKDVKYPVLYLLHGIGGNERNWSQIGRADFIMDNLYADKKAVPMLVVMPNGRASAEPAPANPFAGDPFKDYAAFEGELLKDVIPYVEAHYSVRAERESRALAGLSMGGGQSLTFGLRNLGTFAWVGGFSSAPNTQPAPTLIPEPAAAKEKLRLLWISCGDKDGLMNISKPFHEAVKQMEIAHVWHVDSGGHTWPVWKNDLYLLAQLLFRNK